LRGRQQEVKAGRCKVGRQVERQTNEIRRYIREWQRRGGEREAGRRRQVQDQARRRAYR